MAGASLRANIITMMQPTRQSIGTHEFPYAEIAYMYIGSRQGSGQAPFHIIALDRMLKALDNTPESTFQRTAM